VAIEDQLAAMPLPYAVALRLEAAGAGPELIAVALGIEREAVPMLLDVARRKLTELDGSRNDARPRT
jgi:hypothetical protein